MFRTRRDVEEHVTGILSKIDNDNEKLLKGYTFARLFFQVKDYESAKKYLTGYLSVRQHYAPAHKLMAQIYEATNNFENALQSYKRSLDVDPNQKDIILKICELYCQLPVDPETARYWAERAEQLFPYHDTVFKLREYLVSAEGEPDHQELENLIASDLAAQPKNVDRRIKLLRLYLDTERVKAAYDHATMIESKRLFPYSMDWYYLLCDIFEAYQEEDGKELDSQFYINYLTALDHLIFLTLAEPHAFTLESKLKSCNVNDAAAVLLTFDQVLKRAVQMNIKEGSWIYFIQHMKGQLYFHMTCLLMKRIKMDQANPKEAFRFSAGLALICYTFKPVNLLHEVWFSQMEENQKKFTNFFQQGCLRISFIGHVLLNLCKDDKSNWLQKMKTEVCIPQVKERICSRIFSSLFQKERLQSSYFISDTTFELASLELPSDLSLKEYDKSAYKLCPDSLHHLVWLELHRENAKMSSFDFISEIFKSLQYSNKNLSKGSCESLCVLDLEAYLCAAVYQSKLMIEIKSNINSRNDSVLSYPPDIIDALCTAVQASWWKAAYGLYTSSIKEKLGEHRHNLQQGLEVIRGVGCHGMEIQLVIHLARTFASKADTLDKVSESKTDKNKNKLTSENVTALYFRATHYWSIALGMLDKLMSGKSLNLPKNPVFAHSKKSLSKNDIKAYKEEGELFLAVRLMESDKLNEAAERLSNLSSPYGSYYLALTLKKLASQEQKFSSTRSALLNKAKTSLHETLDRIKDDNTHPLNKEIFIELEDVENDLAYELSIVGDNSCEDPDEVDAYDDSSFQSFSMNKSTIHSTPRPSSKFMSSKHSMKNVSQMSPTKHYEPSPERLDAQIRALALNQDTLVKSFLQQQQTLLDTNKSIVEFLKQNKDVLEQLKKQIEEMSLSETKFQQKTVPKKSIYKTSLDRGNEEDYFDPNGILDYYEDGGGGEEFRHTGYPFDPSSRLAHESTRGASGPLNYVVPPALPPGPPPPLNHYNYQYPHAMLPTPPAAVPDRSSYYHPPPGQGLPFNEGQQLPQFHFHVASTIGKPPPPPPLSTSLPQVVPVLPPASVSVPPLSVPPVVTGLPTPPISVPSISAVVPPPAAAPLSVSNPWSKPNSVVPHAFQIPLPTSTVMASGVSSLPSTVSQITSSATLPAATTSHSQLKDILQTPPVTRTITFTLATTSITSPSIFSGLNRTPETQQERIRYDSETATSPDFDGHDIEREVMGDFKPLIPLPAEIVVETGEENEVVLFEDRAKLFRFADQEWKERGVGIIKILHHEGSGRVRLLMRRDQVLKVCANHYITPNMEIHPMKNSEKAWTWVAQDFADEELRPEHFCIRFKTPEIAKVFKAAFDKAVDISKETEGKKVASPKISTAVTSPASSKPFSSKFLPKQGSWTCPTCYVSNPGDKLLCAACETKKPGSQTSTTTISSPTVVTTSVTSGFSVQFLSKPGSWTCSTCYVNNSPDATSCCACETKKPGSQTSTTSSVTPAAVNTLPTVSNFGDKFLPKAGSWTCSTCYVNNAADKMSCVSCETKKPGFPASTAVPTSATISSAITSDFGSKTILNSVTSSNFMFGGQTNLFTSTSDNISKNVFGGFTFSSNPVIQEAETPEMKDREILLVSTKSKNGPQVTKLNTPKTSPFSGFSFKATTVTTIASSTQSTSVTNSSPFSSFSFKSSVSSTTSSSLPSNNVTNSTSSISLSNIQNLVQNISPTFVFPKSSSDKEISTTVETKTTSSDSMVSGSVFPSFTSDSLKSGGEFVFGVKPPTQSTTFSFGLSSLSSKPSETIGFKPTFSTASNAPAVFGGATQKTEPSQNIIASGGTFQKTDSSQLSSIFGNTSKPDLSQNASLFGDIQKSESKPPVSSFFGGTLEKAESGTPLFGKSSSFETTKEKPFFSGLNEKLESPKSISFGTVSKSEPMTVPPTLSSSVFSFGASEESKKETVPVEFIFGSPQKYEFNFSGVRPKSPTKTPKSPVTPSDVEDDEENESFDADNIYFQPVIPLPPKVDVKTGEENEKTLFCKRAKLFRFCSGEWKERGIGDIKILYDEVGKKVRLLMRRDQVLKVCLNHYLTKDIKFEKRGDKTLSWAATDFSENEPTPELFALRFKTAEFADEFLTAVDNSLTCTETQSSNPDVEKAAASFSFKIDSAPKPESPFTPGSLSHRFGTSTIPSFGSTTSSSASPFADISFSFKDSPATNTFFKFGTNAENQKSSDSKEFAFGKVAEEKQIFDDEIEITHESVPVLDDEDAALAQQLQLPPSFFSYKNKPPCPGCIGCDDFLPPPKNASNEVTDEKETENIVESGVVTQEEESDNPLFNTSSSLSFADIASKTGFEKVTSPNQKKIFEGAGTPLFASLNCSAEGDEDSVSQEPDVHFEPVIPLPELVAVTTGEEDETPIFVERAKLFRFDPLKKEWKERGVGNFKILKHNEKLRFRIILRRDQVHKIACNHCIAPNMELSPLATSNTAMCWNALDYSDGQPEASQFAVRFKNKDLLEKFKEKFNECVQILKETPLSVEAQMASQNVDKSESPVKETPAQENVVDASNEHESSGSETNDEDEESDEDSTMFEKRVSFEISEGNDNEFKSLGMGVLKITYDDEVYGYHVYMTSDSGEMLCEHIIAIQTALRVEKKKASWSAIDLTLDPPRRRRFRATFSSLDALKEFSSVFDEGKEAALHSEIVEKTDCFDSGQQT